MELISIIVPVYNVEKYLRQCIDSILAQTYPNLEIIMVDDGSSDKSGEICDEYAGKYSNIKVIHKQNAGLGMARNTGLEHITGKYVMFVDSDDYIDHTHVENIYSVIEKYHVDVCRCGCRDVSAVGETISETVYPLEIFRGREVTEKLLPRLIGSASDKKDVLGISACTSMYRVSVIREYKIWFYSERELISEDMIFNMDYMRYADGGAVAPVVGYNYRRNELSLTRTYRPDRYKDCVKLHKFVKKRLMELFDSPDIIHRADRMLFVHTRGCIRQERKKISGGTYIQELRNIRHICHDEYIQTVIREYPVKDLEIKQKIFLHMIKCRCSILLLLCMELGLG